jgi:hypothetical protein
VVILAVLSGAELGGVIGVFLSVPVAALLIVCWRHWRVLQQDRSLTLVGADNEPLVGVGSGEWGVGSGEWEYQSQESKSDE